MNETRAEHTLEEHRTVRVDRRLGAAPARVFDAWLDPEKVSTWMMAPHEGELLNVSVDPSVGGAFSFVVRRENAILAHSGEYLAIERPQHLSFTWRVPRQSLETGVVTIDLEPAGEETHLALKHEGVLVELETVTTEGWTAIVEAIAAMLERAPEAGQP